jgi:hypothetical protein
MIDPQTEKLLTMNAARRLPWMRGRFGNDVSLCTITRWGGPGISGISLETLRIGGTVFTSEEATLRFIEGLNGCDHLTRAPRRSRDRQKAQADRRLDEARI